MAQDGNYIFELSPNVERVHVAYGNRFGIRIAADLYRAKDAGDAVQPGIIVGPPYGGVKEQGPGVYANELAQRGFTVLAFDPSYNGYSDGQPRHLSSPGLFVEDFHAAVDFLGTHPLVDRQRIGVIGICGSGGFGLSAAQVDPRIKAVATVSMYDMTAVIQGFGQMPREQVDATLADLAEQRYLDFLNPQPALAPRGSSLELDFQNDPIGSEFGEFYSRDRGYHPNSIAQFTITSMQSFMNFSLLGHLDWIAPRPILLVAGEAAHSRSFAEAVAAQASEPVELYLVPGATHVDLYDRADVIPFGKLEQFFQGM